MPERWGEVFRAYDPRLDREVALKVIAADLDRRAGANERFAQERDDHRIDLLALASGMRVGVRNLRHKFKPEWPKIEIRVI